jgi:hypothetical protein
VPSTETHVVANHVSRVLAIGPAPEGFVRPPVKVLRNDAVAVKTTKEPPAAPIKPTQNIQVGVKQVNGVRA